MTGTERSATSSSADCASSPSPKRGSAARRARSSFERRGDARGRGVLDDDLGGVGGRSGEVALEREEALFRDEAVGERGDAARACVHPEHGHREREQHCRRERQAEPGTTQDATHNRPPEAPFRIGCLKGAASDDGDAEGVDAVAEEAENGRQKRQRGDHGDDPDQDRSHREAAHDRVGDEQHPEHGDDEDAAAEQHRPARGGARGLDRGQLGPSLRALLAVAGDDEQRVIDPEREAHPREHVHEEDRELELLREECTQPERDEDRDDRHQQRHEPGDDRPEDEKQDDQRRREPELELAVLQVLLGEEVEVMVERLRARDRDGERALLVDRFDLLDERLRLVVVDERDRDDRRVAILRDEPGVRIVEVRAHVAESAYLAVVDEARAHTPRTAASPPCTPPSG